MPSCSLRARSRPPRCRWRRVAPGHVVSPSMSEAVSPASAMAPRQASTVSVSDGRISRRPTSDIPIPVIATGPRTGRPSASGGRRLRAAAPPHWPRCNVIIVGSRREHGQPHVVLLLEPHSYPEADVHVVGLRVDDVGREAQRGSSSSATMATTYGGAGSGSHCWWLIVNPTTVLRPGDRGRLEPRWWHGRTRSATGASGRARRAALHAQPPPPAHRSRTPRSRAAPGAAVAPSSSVRWRGGLRRKRRSTMLME